ncbi:RNA polymerase sigma-70 factor [Streptomyces armeniacus]|uniref:RNA polymerase sigma-70 factor n=1 Tax=Streptomyces armeniacus TaxID=83291 RepID=UPI001AD7EFED|nr:RNA polymerase sigma-70 factor [Streptomyces armeniacus]
MADRTVSEFEAQRGRLFGLAYRLLGSAAEAEDAVQDAYLRWESADRAAIAVPAAWLTKAVTNLCLNRLASARVRREEYVGAWLPEPVLTEGGALGPLDTVEQRESVSMALLVLLERLTPAERAVFVLREAFGYPHREIAGIMELGEANCRQLQRRARQRLGAAPPSAASRSAPADRERWHGLVERFLAAARDGDMAGLERLLAADVTSWADGGGVVGTARRPVTGRERVARYLTGGLARFAAGVDFTVAEVNGGPAALAWAGGRLAGVVTVEVAGAEPDGERIAGLRIVANPDKLRTVARQAEALSRF